MRGLELALAQAGFAITDVRLVVCTHAHVDHCGLAAPITEAAGCELWIHPAWGHIRRLIDDPDAALDRRLEVARLSGVPGWALERYEADRRGAETGMAGAAGLRIATWCRGSRWKPTSAPGRSTRPRGTPPPTSSCTSPSGG